MGRFKALICGRMSSYQKFESQQDSDYLCYKCEACGHQGIQVNKPDELTVVMENVLVSTDAPKKLNNCKSNVPQNKLNNLRLVDNLGKSSWSKRHAALVQEKKCISEQQKQMMTHTQIVVDNDQLIASPWFQAGLSRDISAEILSDRPIGSFVVRQSRSRLDCYALSVRVPTNIIIAHYLINTVYQNSKKFYHIKGSKKMFPSLVSLVVHHSVMAENLPCPLLIDHGSSAWINNDLETESRDHDFADTDLADYSNLVMTLRKSISSSTSDIISLTSLD